MKFNLIIITISLILSETGAEYHDGYISPNCTETVNVVTPKFVPYTEVYTTRNFLGMLKQKTRINYRLENQTTTETKDICCKGYNKVADNLCAPICSKGCFKNSDCTRPETCTCSKGYKQRKDSKECEPICEEDCVNGKCTAPNVCTCDEGYRADFGNICAPVCSSCSDIEHCVEPDVCDCIDGYKRRNTQPVKFKSNHTDNGECVAVCDKECVHSDCTLPNFCECHHGYGRANNDPFTCKPVCNLGCKNSECTGPNICTCLKGYKVKPDSNNSVCEPICTLECVNAECISPDTCSCLSGYEPFEKQSHICEPHCSSPCENGRCSAPEICSCDGGYEIRHDKNICEPICTESCIMGNCTSPDTCSCFENYRLQEGSKFICEPICSNKCINGHCTAPEECTCNHGYEKTNSTNDSYNCIPICQCEKGSCNQISPFCVTCEEGYDITDVNGTTICKPHCEGGCINGQCIEPHVCQCNEYYISSNNSEGHTICTHACGMECAHGICIQESGNCSCAFGWSGKYCDEPLLCLISILENDTLYLQLNESSGFEEFENVTMIEQSLPICNSECLKKINNSTQCINQIDAKSSNITCLIKLDLECNVYSPLQFNTNLAEVNITIVVISTILILFVLAIAIYGAIFVRRSRKLSVELMESIQDIQRHPNSFLYENETSSISL